MIAEVYSLNSEINRLLRSGRTAEDRKKFREGIQDYIKSEQKRTALKIFRRIYNNDIKELNHDASSGEKAKILMMVDSDIPLDNYERKKMFGILYPMLEEEFGDLKYSDIYGL